MKTPTQHFYVSYNGQETYVPAHYYVIQDNRLALYNSVTIDGEIKTVFHAVFANWDHFEIRAKAPGVKK